MQLYWSRIYESCKQLKNNPNKGILVKPVQPDAARRAMIEVDSLYCSHIKSHTKLLPARKHHFAFNHIGYKLSGIMGMVDSFVFDDL